MEFKCPVDYQLKDCSSSDYGLTCDTCHHTINNKELFQREYLSKWFTFSEGYYRAYELWIDYEYNCEKFDKTVCHGGVDSQGFIKPSSGYELKLINENANYLRDKVWIRSKELAIPNKDLEDARKDVNKLTWKGIQEEYQRLSGNQI